MVPLTWAPSSRTVPWAIRPRKSALPPTASPSAATATPPAPTVTSRRHTCPLTFAWSSRVTESTTEDQKFRMPSRRIRVPLNPGSREATIRTVFADDSKAELLAEAPPGTPQDPVEAKLAKR